MSGVRDSRRITAWSLLSIGSKFHGGGSVSKDLFDQCYRYLRIAVMNKGGCDQ